MKKYILFALFAFWMCNSLNAQPYKLFKPFIDYLYSDANNYYHGFRIIKTDSDTNGDSILIPFQEKIMFRTNCDRFYSSWISYRIIQKPDGTDILLNQNYDSILIKTQALLNESWDCYHYKNGARIDASIKRWDTLSFLGVIDSAKTISFAYFDSKNKRIPNRVDSFCLVLSKNYGLIQTVNFIYFPDLLNNTKWPTMPGLDSFILIGLGKALGKQNINNSGIYNFSPGDEIDILTTEIYTHPLYLRWDSIKTKQTILNRIDSDNRVSYEIREIIFQINANSSGTQTNHSETTKWYSYILNDNYNQLESLPELSIPIMSGSNSFKIYSSSMCLFNKYLMKKNITGDWLTSWANIDIKDSCYVRIDEGYRITYDPYYIEGLGGPYYWYTAYDYYQENEKKPVYYKKGAETWGVPLSVKPEQIHSQQPQIQIFPNPYESSATVSVSTAIKGKIQIINQLGQVVYEKDISSGQNTITLYKEKFNSGVYILKLIQQNGNQSSKIFVVQ